MPTVDIDSPCINTTRNLRFDAVQHASSGHAATRICTAVIGYALSLRHFLRTEGATKGEDALVVHAILVRDRAGQQLPNARLTHVAFPTDPGR